MLRHPGRPVLWETRLQIQCAVSARAKRAAKAPLRALAVIACGCLQELCAVAGAITAALPEAPADAAAPAAPAVKAEADASNAPAPASTAGGAGASGSATVTTASGERLWCLGGRVDTGRNAKLAGATTFREQRCVTVREHYQKDGAWLPGAKGLNLTPEQFETLCSHRQVCATLSVALHALTCSAWATCSHSMVQFVYQISTVYRTTSDVFVRHVGVPESSPLKLHGSTRCHGTGLTETS